ncbi:hypothetical protein U7230_10380 [Carboxydochorda subterranea]|uniref:Helicase XPB/Ssl2 N-terminal domain-containing protein n=1 Tax=Carboxydichorda subterranea TaxID=3109565 RepID=A0ABZ1BV55_9FIRM|nr:hypothetical protein [Limnochorda sp. L945t]WRP16500.1 hypothetical protein U7230_10380 [Limnochorda sp. L945t]
MEYRQLTGGLSPADLDSDAYHALSPAGRTALLTLLFSRASLPAPELAGLGAEQATARVATLVGRRQDALLALWEARRSGLAVLIRERRYDLYMLPDEARAVLWPIGARSLHSRQPPITFVVDSPFTTERFDEVGAESAGAFLYDVAALIAFVRSEQAELAPSGVLTRKAQGRLAEYLSVKEQPVQDAGPVTSYPPRTGFLVEIARRAGLVQVSPGEGERLQEGPLASAWLEAPPGPRLARLLAAWAGQLAGSEVDSLLVLDAARWLAAPGRGVWIKGFAEAVSYFEDEPYPAYRLVSLVRTLQRLAWLGAVFMWKVRWSEEPPPSDQAGNVSIKPAPSQRKGLPPLANVAFALTGIGRALWEGLSHPKVLLRAATLHDEGDDQAERAWAGDEADGRATPPAGTAPPAPDGAAGNGHLQADAAGAREAGERQVAEEEDRPGEDLAEALGRLLPQDEPHAFVEPNFELLAPRHMRPDRLSRLIELSQVVRADRMVQLRLDVERCAAGVRSGRWTPAEVLALLEVSSRHELPQNVRYALVEALKPLGRVQLMDGILVRSDDAVVQAAVLDQARKMGVVAEAITPDTLWIERRHLPMLIKAAEASGYPVRRWVRGTRVPYPAEKAAEVGAALENAARLSAREAGQLIDRRPAPSLVRGRRDLLYVPPGNEPGLAAPADREGGVPSAAGGRGSPVTVGRWPSSRGDDLGVQA